MSAEDARLDLAGKMAELDHLADRVRFLDRVQQAERKRIRNELLEAWPEIIGYSERMARGPYGRLRAALDRICPTEGE